MPELAEVEFARRRWDVALGRVVERAVLDPTAQVFREVDAAAIARALRGRRFIYSEARGKQICFRFDGNLWLGVHLGMSGELRVEGRAHRPERHDHLVLHVDDLALVFRDPRRFGRVRFARGKEEPAWWSSLPPSLLSPSFTRRTVDQILERRARSPIKAVLLQQDSFPGVGNWMADEILWRAGIHPARAAGQLSALERAALRREVRFVVRGALRSVGRHGGDPPRGWLFAERWRDGGTCPRTGVTLVRETIGGRTTCWSPALQIPVVKE